MYYGRKIDNEDEVIYQLLKEHLENVANLCNKFMKNITSGQVGLFIGLLHDIGKYSEDFQRRLKGENIKVGHALAGAKFAEAKYEESKGTNPIYRLLAHVISGHHRGLEDFGTPAQGLCKKLKEEIAECEAWKEEIKEVPIIKPMDMKMKLRMETLGFSLQFYTRFLFSCLVDADRIDAQNFPNQEATRLMSGHATVDELKERFELHMSKLKSKAKKSEINSIRNQILNSCIDKAKYEKGFFSLTVPTGGGKTLSSLAFALNHAILNGHDRIIYTIPFTSIIEQNAQVFSQILGRENVLEHHSNFENPFTTQEETLKLKIAQENWHEPVIVTTNVQFFETLFSHKASKVRKLHNIANSIIILDEVQSIPNKYIEPCMCALNELVVNYGCTVVLCSATQPEFDKNNIFKETVKIQEIIDDTNKLFKALRRTTEHYIGDKDINEIASQIKGQNQVLCIVNTKRHARDIYDLLSKEDNVFHLSTNMYPLHRQETLKKIRELLLAGLPCKVISTQLIEAGVDIDFPVVYRAMAGIDSIVQAAGRCNREGKLETGHVYVFRPEEKYIGKEYLALTAELGRMIVEATPRFLDLSSISQYFYNLFGAGTNLDVAGILEACQKACQNPTNLSFEFETMSDHFKFIENQGYTLVIEANEEVTKLLESIKFTKTIGGALKKLATYSINVKRYELEQLDELGAIKCIEDRILVLTSKSLYDEKLGLAIRTPEEDFEYVI